MSQILCLACNTLVDWLGPAYMVLSNTFKWRCPKCGWVRTEPGP